MGALHRETKEPASGLLRCAAARAGAGPTRLPSFGAMKAAAVAVKPTKEHTTTHPPPTPSAVIWNSTATAIPKTTPTPATCPKTA